MSDTFRCALCGEEFTKTRSDAEAWAEAKAKWGEITQPVIVCDTCAERVTAWRKAQAHKLN